MNNKYENTAMCEKCQGYCCKKCGCTYFVSDIKDFSLASIEQLLDTNRVSIIATLIGETLPNGKTVDYPILSLRARNINRGAIDLISFKTKCANLTPSGCIYSLNERPSGGVKLIPNLHNNERLCFPDFDMLTETKKWLPYQKVLSRIVKRRTGLSVNAKIDQDLENLMYEYASKKYQDVSKEEILDVHNMLLNLKNTHPIPLYKGLKKAEAEQSKLILKRKKEY